MDTNKDKKIVLMMGAPASGKSTVRKHFFSEVNSVDCDEIKKLHPDYNPKAITNEVHEWSSKMAREILETLINSNKSFVYDSTGTTAEKLVSIINKAKEQGYKTMIVYVRCDLETCLQRNKDRERTVRDSIVKEKWELVETSFSIVSNYVDETMILDSKNLKF